MNIALFSLKYFFFQSMQIKDWYESFIKIWKFNIIYILYQFSVILYSVFY